MHGAFKVHLFIAHRHAGMFLTISETLWRISRLPRRFLGSAAVFARDFASRRGVATTRSARVSTRRNWLVTAAPPRPARGGQDSRPAARVSMSMSLSIVAPGIDPSERTLRPAASRPLLTLPLTASVTA